MQNKKHNVKICSNEKCYKFQGDGCEWREAGEGFIETVIKPVREESFSDEEYSITIEECPNCKMQGSI